MRLNLKVCHKKIKKIELETFQDSRSLEKIKSKRWMICCKIAEAQITKIDCEIILGLRNIFKQTLGTKKINPKENRHKNTEIYVVQQ